MAASTSSPARQLGSTCLASAPRHTILSSSLPPPSPLPLGYWSNAAGIPTIPTPLWAAALHPIPHSHSHPTSPSTQPAPPCRTPLPPISTRNPPSCTISPILLHYTTERITVTS